MGKANFEKLEVYNISEELADAIWNTVKSWGAFSKVTIGKQIVRSADSIGANIAEGVGRWSFRDNKRFVRVARGSLNETIHWIRTGVRAADFLTRSNRVTCKGLLTNLHQS